MVSIKQLYDLQELDWEIAAAEESLAQVRARLADDSAVVTARKRLENTEAQLVGPTAARRHATIELEEVEEKLLLRFMNLILRG